MTKFKPARYPPDFTFKKKPCCYPNIFVNIIVEIPEERPISVKLEGIMPIPKRAPAKKVQKRQKHPSFEITSPECREFIRVKDKDYLMGKPKEPKTNKARILKTLKDVPQPFFKGKKGDFCGLCLSWWGDEDSLGEVEMYMVKCPYCGALMHHNCMKICRDCACGERVRVQRKSRD